MPGSQHRLLIGDGRLLLIELANFNDRSPATAVENWQADARANGPLSRSPFGEVRRAQRLLHEAARQRDARIQIGDGNADLRGRGVQLRFGSLNVRTPTRDFRGNAARNRLR